MSRDAERYRLTIPIVGAHFDDLGVRCRLREGCTLAPLNSQEAGRVHGYYDLVAQGERVPVPRARLELDVRLPRINALDIVPSAIENTVHEAVSSCMSLLVVASGCSPAWLYEPIDQWSAGDSQWIRQGVSYRQGGELLAGWPTLSDYLPIAGSPPEWIVSPEAQEAWATLLQNWPSAPEHKRLAVALTFLAEAFGAASRSTWTAMAAASITVEAILGDNRPELSHRIAVRAAHLSSYLAKPAAETFNTVKKAYTARSTLVHAGTTPSTDVVVQALETARTLTPVMAALVTATGSHKEALAQLDSAALGGELPALAGGEAGGTRWWHVPQLAVGSASPPLDPVQAARMAESISRHREH